MRIYAIAVGLLSISMFSGCTSVYFHHPVGEPLTEDKDEVSEKFDGTWVNEDGEPAQLKYLGDGKLCLASLQWDDEEQEFSKEEGTVLLTTHKSAEYMNVKDEDADDARIMFARYSFAGERTMLIWMVRTDAFEKAVKNGDLPGTIEKVEHSTTIDVTASKEELEEFIDPSRVAEQFEVETPIVLTRLGN